MRSNSSGDEPRTADDYWILGSRHLQEDELEQAEECFKQVLAISPTHAYALNNMGVISEKRGQRRKAENFYRLALKKSPENLAIKWSLAGVSEDSEEAKWYEAMAIFGLTAACGSSHVVYHSDKLSVVKIDFDGKRICAELKKPQAIDPVDVYEKLGVDFLKKGQLALAEESFKKAARACRTPAFLRRVGTIKYRHGLIEEAIETMKKLAEASPDDFMVHVDLGLLYSKLWKTDQVEQHLEQANRIAKRSRPDGRLKDMITRYMEQELKMTQNYNTGILELLGYLRKVARWKYYEKTSKTISMFADTCMGEPDRLPPMSPDLSLMFPSEEGIRKEIAVLYARKTAIVAQSLVRPPYQHPKPNGRERRVKVGYVLGHHDYDGDFENLASMDAVIGMHDQSKVEVFVYVVSDRKAEGGRRYTVDSVVEHFTLLREEEDDGKVADRIHADGIDILISMTEARNEIFALRPAPIQVAWLGNRGTSGADFIDYFITDRVATPLESARFFTEKLAYMPKSLYVGNHAEMFPEPKEQVKTTAKKQPQPQQPPSLFQRVLSWFDLTSQPMDSEETTKEDPTENDYARTKEITDGRKRYGLPEKATVYGNFAGLYRCNPATAEMWARILVRVPKSVLWLLRDPVAAEPNVREFFEEDYNIPSHRILFCDVTTDDEEMMWRGQLIDVYLDNTMWSAGAMGLDILWLGVPMVTLPEESLISRGSTSQLNALESPELVAQNGQDYIQIAVDLGKNPEQLRNMRTKIIKARPESKLFDVQQYCRDFEELLFTMWRRYKNFMKPDHITD